MDWFDYILKLTSSLGGLGFFVGIIIAYKIGLLDFVLKLKKNGNGVSEHRIEDLEAHAKIANDEMREIRDRLGRIEADVNFIRGKLDK